MANTPSDPEIEISFGEEEIGSLRREEGPYRIGDHGFEIAVPAVARYRCFDGRRIWIAPHDGVGADDVAAMLIATVLPAMLWARGDVVLHAACALLPGDEYAVAVAGPSGSGKSTWLAAAVAAGWRVIADDSVRLRHRDGVVLASGLPAGWFGPLTDGEPQRPFHRVPSAIQLPEHALRALFVLTPGNADPVQLRGTAALEALLQNRHRPRIARLLGQEAAMLPRLAEIRRSVAIHTVPAHARNLLAMTAGI